MSQNSTNIHSKTVDDVLDDVLNDKITCIVDSSDESDIDVEYLNEEYARFVSDKMKNDEHDEYFYEAPLGPFESCMRNLLILWKIICYYTKRFLKWILFGGAFVVMVCILLRIVRVSQQVGIGEINNGAINTFDDIQHSLMHLQKQINKLNTDQGKSQQSLKQELNSNLNLIIGNLESQFKKLIGDRKPHGEIEKLKSDIDNLRSEMHNISKLESNFVERLATLLPSEIPIIQSNNETSIVPEFNSYLVNVIPELVNSILNDETSPVATRFQFNQQKYIKETLLNELHMLTRKEFLDVLNERLKEQHAEFTRELASVSSKNVAPQAHYSSVLLRKMISKIYTAQHHKKSVNFATFAMGTRLLTHLTSKTLDDSVTALELLSDSPGDSTYWKTQVHGSWTIRFQESIYLTDVYYTHGRVENAALMSSCPKRISVYAKTTTPVSGNTYKGYTKLGEVSYDIYSPHVSQPLPIPLELTEKKALVKSLMFKVEENWGHPQFTAIKKFTVNGLTRDDLTYVKEMSTDVNYGEALLSDVQFELPPSVPAFGSSDAPQ